VFNQTYNDYEVILVDDGSTDDTEERIQPFLSRINYIKQANAGQASAKNRGGNAARGEFVAFLDADDQWTADKLEKQMALFSDPRVGVVFSRQSFVDEKSRTVILEGRRRPTMRPRSGKVTSALFMDNFVPFSSSVVRIKCFRELGGFDESIAMGIDWDLWLRFSTRYHFAFVDEPLLIYRVGHRGQMSKNALKRQECSDRIMAKFLANHPEEISTLLYRKAMAFTFCNRGLYFRHRNLQLSTGYFLKAFASYPLWLGIYSGIMKNFLLFLMLLVGARRNQ
jgi:glycosyltransferase involved in cell wall biosynthesis